MENSKQTNNLLSDNEEDIEILESSKDIEKLNSMWRQLKESKKSINQNLALPSQKGYTKPVDKSNNWLNESIQRENLNEDYEKIINKLKEKNSFLTKKLAEAQEEIDKCHEKIAKERSVNLQKTSHIEDLENDIETNLNIRNSNTNDCNENEKYQIKISKLQSIIFEFQEKNSDLINRVDDLETRNELIMQELNIKNNENMRIRSKISETENAIDTIILQKQTESTALLELEYLKSDVSRLLNLLQSTQEFKEFSLYAAENNNEIRFLKDIIKKFPNRERKIYNNKKNRSCCKNEKEDEKLLWVPKESLDISNQIIEKYSQTNLNMEFIQEILYEFNKLWNLKEQKKIEKIKNLHENEINKIKRHYSSLAGMNEVQAKKTISHLQNQLKNGNNRQENKENYHPEPIKFIFEKEDKKQIQEKNNIDDNKIVYLEGSLWMGNKIIKELFIVNDFLQKLDRVFKDKLSEILDGSSLRENFDEKTEIFNFFEWILDNLYQVFNGYKDKINFMREKTKMKLKQNTQRT